MGSSESVGEVPQVVTCAETSSSSDKDAGPPAADCEDDLTDWVIVDLEEAANEALCRLYGVSPAGAAMVMELMAMGNFEDQEEGKVLDEAAFPGFAPLLAASQSYASHSGCRFRGSDFSDALAKDMEDPMVLIPDADNRAAARVRLSARLEAAPVVTSFVERIKSKEAQLDEEIRLAYDLMMEESVRNAMVAAFRELDMWPPSTAPADVAEDDCNFKDLSAPVPAIAQRTFNDDVLRKRSAVLGKPCQKATTASYIIDFVYEAGVELPTAAGSQHITRLKEFGDRIADWERKIHNPRDIQGFSGSEEECTSTSKDTVHREFLNECKAASARQWSQHWREAMWTFSGAIFRSAGLSLLRRSLRSEGRPIALQNDANAAQGEDSSEELDAQQSPPPPQTADTEVLAK